nr:MAG TPA: hypothetical protein [Caudoviricetes sp.]
MTIHDILVNCASVQSDTIIIIVNDYEEVNWIGTFRELPKDCEELKFKYFTIGVIVHKHVARAHFKFRVQGADTMRYEVPIHPIPIGSIIKYNVREYGYFYGDGQEKRAISIARIGKVINVIEHNGRVVYYSVAPSSNCTYNQFFVGDCLDSVWPENVDGVHYDN